MGFTNIKSLDAYVDDKFDRFVNPQLIQNPLMISFASIDIQIAATQIQEILTSESAVFNDPIEVWRLASGLSKFRVGSTVRMNGFQSTSLDPSVVIQSLPEITHAILLRIHTTRGGYVSDTEGFHILLPHAARPFPTRAGMNRNLGGAIPFPATINSSSLNPKRPLTLCQ